MRRARFLTGAAVLWAACAFNTPAQAVGCAALGMPFLPPPCIVMDAAKIASQAAEISKKAAEVKELAKQAQEFTSIQSIIGKVNSTPLGSFGGMEPIAPIPQISFAKAANDLTAAIPQGTTPDQTKAALEFSRLTTRSAAGDGYAIAKATQTRLIDLAADAAKIQQLSGSVSNDVRADMQVNTQARSLMYRALATLKEVTAARMSLGSMLALRPTIGKSTISFDHNEAPAQTSTVAPEYAQHLGNIANLSNELQALVTARQLSSSYTDSLNGFKQTQTEYQAILNAAKQSQAQVQAIANSDARRKGKSAAQLLALADQIMASRDRTVWDDPSKIDVAKNAAAYAEKQLDKAVSGDVNNRWSDYLEARAEAYKEEAFFRPINADAIAMQADTIQSMKDYSASIGMDITNVSAIDQKIAQIQQQLAVEGKALDSAPESVRAQRDAIYTSSLSGSNYDGGTPNMNEVGVNDLGSL